MADVVGTFPIYTGRGLYCWKFTSISDGAGETNVIKIDVSTLTNTVGGVGTKINIQEVAWSIQGFAYVQLSFDYGTDVTAALLTGNGGINYEKVGREIVSAASATGGTGDLLLSTGVAAANATYDITVVFRVD